MPGLLRPLAHLASLLALGVWALALGRWLRDPGAGSGAVGLLLLALVIAFAMRRLYGPGGVAAPRSAPEAVPAAPVRAARRESPPSHLWAGDDRIDINAADVEALQRLPGVGPVAARRIVECREADGPFGSVEALTRVPGFGPAKVRALADRART